MQNQTIYALSTVYGKSGVAVIRISGVKALCALEKMTRLNTQTIAPRQAYFCTLIDVETKEPLDKVLVIYFKAPHSFTGEDTVEIHCHGSKAVLVSVLNGLAQIEDFRLAEAGEFSKRAFYHNKMDLTEAEGLADLIDAETSAQQKQALKQMSGVLRKLYDKWREELLKVYAYLEAYIDFPEEGIDPHIMKECLETVGVLQTEIKGHLNASKNGERLRDGFQVVLTGPTNAGKSSLMNAIVERQAVIVSDIAGTTRDAVDVHLDMAGYPVILTDTAGLRQTDNEIEKQGIEITHQKVEDADLILALFDGACDSKDVFKQMAEKFGNKMIYIANKADKLSVSQKEAFLKEGYLLISAKTKEGLPALFETLKNRITADISPSSTAIITRVRYREALKECLENLEAFSFDKPIELAGEDIRLAARALGKITGKIEVGEILDKIFGSFCIGK